MYNIFSNIKTIVSNFILSDKKDYELEIRFGKKNQNKFDPNIGKNLFESIFDLITKHKFYDLKENAFIHDKIYNNYIERKIKKVSKLMFDEKFFIDENDSDVFIQKMSKEKIDEYTTDFLRLSFNKEHNLNSEKYSGDLKFERMKYRVSVLFLDIFRFDFTIVNNKEYIVEIEILLDKITNINDFEKKYKNLNKKLKPIIEILTNDIINNIKPPQPHTMNYSDLFVINSNKYSVTDKADGVRSFLKINNNISNLINPKTNEIIKKCLKCNLKNTLLDGEYVNNRFYAFDLMFYDGKDYRNENLIKRLEILKQNIRKIQVGLIIKAKTFYFGDIFNNSKKIINKIRDDYKIDGLIFTPIEQSYECKELPIFKWKKRHTIDVRVKYNTMENFTYFIYGKKYGYINKWKSEYFERDLKNPNNRIKKMKRLFNNENYRNLKNKNVHFGKYKLPRDSKNFLGEKIFLGKKGKPNEDFDTGRTLNKNIDIILDKYDIIEYEFRNNEWFPLRKRTFDKDEANAKKTIEGVLRAIDENLQINKMIEFKNKYKFDSIGLKYNQVSQDRTFKRDNWRIFHNFVKRDLIKQASNSCNGGAYLDLACGKGGDLHKYINLGYKNILAIDSSSVELYCINGYINRLCKMGFIDKGLYFQKNDIKVTVICGDISKNIRNGDCVNNDEDKQKIENFFKKVKKFDVISIMFAIHYMLENHKKSKNFFNNIISLLKQNGKLIGTYINYDIEEDLIFKNHEIPFYKIKNKKNKIEISNSVWGWNKSIVEPIINDFIINQYFKDFNLISVYNNSFEDLYDIFKMKESIILKEDEKKLGFMNNYFMVIQSPEKNKTIDISTKN